MKLCITSQGDTLGSQVDPRFGRCAYFIVVDTETMEFEAASNQSAGLGGGAGIQAAQFVSDKGVKTLLTGNCGPNAYRTLHAAGVEVITGVSGTIEEAVESYKSSKLSSSEGPNVDSHFGMKGGN